VIALSASADELNEYVRSLYTNNAAYGITIPANTQGEILQTQQLANGNYGVLVNVTSGPQAGSQVWVPYNTTTPLMNLYTSQATMAAGQSTAVLSQAQMMMTNASVAAYRAPVSSILTKQSAEDTLGRVNSMNSKVAGFGKPGGECEECELAKIYQRDTDSASSSSGSRREPIEKNPHGITPSRCKSLDQKLVFESCTYEGDDGPARFKVTNSGPNSMVTKKMDNRYRQFSFEAPGFATQDMLLTITDSPSSRDSESQESYMMFFPRKVLPSMTSTSGGGRVVTLPTGEIVTFDAQGQVVSGPLKENQPLTAGVTPKISYAGSGLTVRVDARGSDPRVASKSGGTATITKDGRHCQVPKKELWPDQRESSAMHFAFPNDRDFKNYIQKKCGFSF
jgi:hypothetical protein